MSLVAAYLIMSTTKKETVFYTIKENNPYQIQIKSGRKVMEKLTAASGGWSFGTIIYPSVEIALREWKRGREEFCAAMGQEIEINFS